MIPRRAGRTSELDASGFLTTPAFSVFFLCIFMYWEAESVGARNDCVSDVCVCAYVCGCVLSWRYISCKKE